MPIIRSWSPPVRNPAGLNQYQTLDLGGYGRKSKMNGGWSPYAASMGGTFSGSGKKAKRPKKGGLAIPTIPYLGAGSKPKKSARRSAMGYGKCGGTFSGDGKKKKRGTGAKRKYKPIGMGMEYKHLGKGIKKRKPIGKGIKKRKSIGKGASRKRKVTGRGQNGGWIAPVLAGVSAIDKGLRLLKPVKKADDYLSERGYKLPDNLLGNAIRAIKNTALSFGYGPDGKPVLMKKKMGGIAARNVLRSIDNAMYKRILMPGAGRKTSRKRKMIL